MNPLKTTYYNFGDLVAVSPKIQSKRKLLVPENTKIMSMMCDFWPMMIGQMENIFYIFLSDVYTSSLVNKIFFNNTLL